MGTSIDPFRPYHPVGLGHYTIGRLQQKMRRLPLCMVKKILNKGHEKNRAEQTDTLFTILYRPFKVDHQIDDVTHLSTRIIKDKMIGIMA
jgi:hypothetical protein